MTPLETQLLNALRLRRATSWPFAPAPHGLGLDRTEENGSTAAWARRNAEADKAVDDAIRAGEAAEAALPGGWIEHYSDECPTARDARVDVRFLNGCEFGGNKAGEWGWHRSRMPSSITHWRPAV